MLGESNKPLTSQTNTNTPCTYMELGPKIAEAAGKDAPGLGRDEGDAARRVRHAVDAQLLAEGLVAEADDSEAVGVCGLWCVVGVLRWVPLHDSERGDDLPPYVHTYTDGGTHTHTKKKGTRPHKAHTHRFTASSVRTSPSKTRTGT